MNAPSIITPTQALRRSPLYRQQQALGAEFISFDQHVWVGHYGKRDQELGQAEQLGLIDLSPGKRVGFKGPGTLNWAQTQQLEVPAKPNQAVRQGDVLIGRLSAQELFILEAPGNAEDPDHAEDPDNAEDKAPSKVEALNAAWSLDLGTNTYLLPRADSHGWLALTGSQAAETLSKVCAVDARPHKFADGAIAQTSIARVNGILIRQDQGETLCYYLLADISSLEFLWEGLCDAMQEFHGIPIGLHAFQQLST